LILNERPLSVGLMIILHTVEYINIQVLSSCVAYTSYESNTLYTILI